MSPTGQQQYRRMDTAPTDRTVIMGLCQHKYPEAIYYSADAWHFWHRPIAEICLPDFWCRLPGDTPSDYYQSDLPARSDWLGMNSAPLDGTNVLVLVSPDLHPVVAYYDAGWKAFVGGLAVVPLYWLPEPTLPVGYP